MAVRPIDGTWSKFVWNLGESSESLARKFREGKACLVVLRLAVEAQPTITPPNEWVSVEDAVPDPGVRVLAANGNFVGEAYMASNGAWMRHDGFPWEVDAWMPMPDRRPPEGDA